MVTARDRTHPTWATRLGQPVVTGVLAATGLVAFYLVVITVAQDRSHALLQLRTDAWFVGAITAGFGTQVGLFTYLRALQSTSGSGAMVASTGTSTVAMLACCAHHLTDVLPILGLSGAVIFLNQYKTPLLWLGIAMNLAGIIYLSRRLRETTVNPVDCVAAPISGSSLTEARDVQR